MTTSELSGLTGTTIMTTLKYRKQHKREAAPGFFATPKRKPISYPQLGGKMKDACRRAAEKQAQAHPFSLRKLETMKHTAKRWLRQLLSEGPVYNHDVQAIAKAAGVPFDILEQAKESLGVTYANHNDSRHACWRLWFWQLPEDELEDEGDDDFSEEEGESDEYEDDED
jgi:hypothetical protein